MLPLSQEGHCFTIPTYSRLPASGFALGPADLSTILTLAAAALGEFDVTSELMSTYEIRHGGC